MARTVLPICGAVTAVWLTHSAEAFAVDCFVDSVAGDDTKTGLAEDQALKTQAKMPSACTVARFKRGSVFNEPVKVSSKITTYTNYGDPCAPLPKFSIQRSPNNGSIFRSFTSGVTIDGLYLSGSMSDAAMTNLMNGICVMLGSNSKLLNSEITNCDIGVMLTGEGNLVQGNYVHDLYISVDAAPGVDPNDVGGAQGIFINASNNEVAYNSFIRCSSTAEWTGGSCDGGATEVSVGAGKTLSGVKVHHNFSYKSCGFFEMASMAGATKGTFADSVFYNNVSVDSGWLMLLQVNNTNTSNIRWENNTVVQHRSQSINPGMLVTVFTGTSSGVSGGALLKDTVALVNGLFILDGFGTNDYVNALDPNLSLVNTLTIKSPATNPGVVNVAGTTARDFDLVAGSPAIDKGTATNNALDYLNRQAPSGGAMDVGAFEFGATLGAGHTAPVPAEDAVTANGCGTPGGAAGAGGANGVGGQSTGTDFGGTNGQGGSVASQGGAVTGQGGASNPQSGVTSGQGGALETTTNGAGVAASSGQVAGNAGNPVNGSDTGGCECRLGRQSGRNYVGFALLGFMLALCRKSSTRRQAGALHR